MDSSSRHRFIESPGSSSTPLPVQLGSRCCYGDITPGIWQTLADGTLHRLPREPVRTGGAERREPRAVADQRHGAPVGERGPLNALLALLGACRLSIVGRRT